MKRIIVLHHTVTPQFKTSIKAIERDHEKRFGRSFYGKIITPYQTHHIHDEWNFRTSNMVSFDIALTGDFRMDELTGKQITDAVAIITDIMQHYNIKGITAHRYLAEPGSCGCASESECPGEAFNVILENIRNINNKITYRVK